MSESASEWLARWPWRTEPGGRLLTDLELRDLLRQAYEAGYEACRESRAPRTPT